MGNTVIFFQVAENREIIRDCYSDRTILEGKKEISSRLKN